VYYKSGYVVFSVVVPKTGALHGFATEETSTHTAVTVKPINDNGIYLLSNFRKKY
jgi:hypothetical protein